MASITCFDDFSPELILCIFDFLSTADRYNSFFDINSYLRSLVKKHTEFSRKELDADILRFSTLHSWYKHLSFDDGGVIYFIIPTQGQQPRYSFDPCVTDADGLHWRFIRKGAEENILNEHVRAVVTRYPFRLNAFFYHLEIKSSDQSTKERSFDSGDIIKMRWKMQLQNWLQINYPDFVNEKESLPLLSLDSDSRNYNSLFVPIFDSEWLKATSAIQKAAVQVWNELKEFDDVNPLQL